MTTDTDRVPAKTWVAIVAATIGAFMAVLNIQIVNAALADIQGAIGASAGDGGWISTSYLVAEIVVIPMTAWLARVFSFRRYLITNAALFLFFSCACAFARDIEQMIVLRALQGFTGGVLIPMAFTLIMTLLPKSRQPTGLAIFAVAASFAPAIGPAVGGYLAGTWGWQAIFYVNLVPGSVMLVLLVVSLERQPMQLGLLRQGDWAGIATMALGLGALQVVLEEGNKEDWFDSPFIVRLAVVAAASLALFVWIELRSPQPLLNLRLLGRRNFGAGVLAMFLLGAAIYGSVFILPAYLARIQGYNAEQIGMVLAWTGLPQILLIPLVPVLMRKVDARWLVVVGIGLFALSNFLNVGLTADVAADQLMLPNIVRAIGQALVLTPLTALAIGGIDTEDAGSASALLNVMRNQGGAVAIALLQTILATREQFHAGVLGESITLFDEATRVRLDQLTRYFLEQGVTDAATAGRDAVIAIVDQVHRQAYTMAIGDVFLLLGAVLVAALGAALFLGRPAARSTGTEP
ncbi:MAG: MDR family MFS transporter [Reyranella sp.]|nr:MDR family MFS transporter [Reyranella sp.]